MINMQASAPPALQQLHSNLHPADSAQSIAEPLAMLLV